MSNLNPKTIWQIDAFSEVPLRGNAAGVVFDADDLPAATMQAIARETNLSETVFLLRPSEPTVADYRARIFTPRSELPFAGHPTLAAAWAVLHRRDTGPRRGEVLRQECGIGIIPVEVRDEDKGHGPLLVMTQMAPQFTAVVGLETKVCAGMLGCPGGASDLMLACPLSVVSTGAPWLIVPFEDPAALAAARPDLALVEQVARDCQAMGVTAFARLTEPNGTRLKLRTFVPGEGIAEDPVCGSGNGAVGAYVARYGLLDGGPLSYWAEQGTEISRGGKVLVEVEPQAGSWAVRVGGRAVLVIEGRLYAGG
jgi:PhzF family phenazine biosynthesis protein